MKRDSLPKYLKILPVAILLIYIVFMFGQALCRNAAQSVRRKEMQQRVWQAERKNRAMKEHIRELNTNEGIENEARQKLGMSAPGEVGYRVIKKKTPAAGVSPQAPPQTAPQAAGKASPGRPPSGKGE